MTTPQGTNYVGLPHPGAWLVYINGVEVPCPSVNVSYGVWLIPEASLSFPPHRLLHRLGAEDRVEVAIFFLDKLADPLNPTFKLLFDGEIIGWSYTSSGSGRQMTFNAVADISVFTQLYYAFLNNVDTIADYAVTPNPGAVAQPGAFYPFSLFKKGLLVQAPEEGKNPSPPDITKPFEIVYNAVRGMVDQQLNNQTPVRRSIPAVNFFSRWARKRNFVNRFCSLPVFEDTPNAAVFPIIEAAQSTTALQSIQQNVAGPIGNAGSMWDVLKETYSHVYFEIAMLPTAPSARVRIVDSTGASDGTIIGPATTAISATDANKQPLRILNYFVKPQMFFGIAPTCNVIFPSMVSSYSYTENYMAQPTRTYVNDQFITSALAQNVFVSAALSFGYPPDVDVILAKKVGRAFEKDPTTGKPNAAGIRQLSSSGKNLLIFPEEFYKGPVMNRMAVPAWFSYLKNREGKTTRTVDAQPDATNEQEAASLHELMQSYVEYEHFRGRYEKRGGAVNMAFNPYVVPGFPCVIFDHKASGFHTIGYMSNVTQTLTLDGMSTAINYGLSRTIPEMLDQLNNDLAQPANKGKIFGSAPLEPIEPVRNIIQDFTQAEQFYNALFFQRQTLTNGKKASFDFREVIGYDRTDGGVDPITLAINTVGSSGATGTTEVTTSLSNNLTGTRNVVPLPKFNAVFNQYDTAMQYVSRPICTLEEYVEFIHGSTSNLDALEESGQVQLGDARFGNVPYFKRIKKLTFNAAYVPTAAEIGVTFSATGQPAAFEGNPIGAQNPSQTRADWDSALVAYQAEMYSRKGPQQ